MSEGDSFINEVSEEVRRDRLYRLLRRYGWIAVLAVVLVVGGAAWIEWRRAASDAAAQEFGTAVLEALEAPNVESQVAALDDVEATATAEQRAMLAMIRAGLAAEAGDDTARELAEAALADLGGSGDIAPLYRDLASLKRVMLAGDAMPADERRRVLDGLAVPGAPYRLLALEQLAILDVEAGDTDAALTTLNEILSDDGASQNLRRRVGQLIVALGGEVSVPAAEGAAGGQ